MSIVKFKALKGADANLLPPKRASEGAAGFDICANLTEDVVITPGEIAIIPTGMAIALPENTEAQIRPRSGLAIKYGVSVANAPGTIDCDYRGEVKVGLINLGKESFTITHGMRIAQMVIAPVMIPTWQEGELDDSDRGEGGFGSTGLK